MNKTELLRGWYKTINGRIHSWHKKQENGFVVKIEIQLYLL
jgi:hypothetical protein